ncbi:trichohyalin-like isoform X2 [Xenia sp. Carnegie-2017]|uniref:trichohyalin-like isoform X2 n=1 Tax=Xenia sp. Carnegie-2017 TaxID=2897299 RepID=UPI001F049500|nr:trichohyalin-like isoform X2 [Xenia sp. Carnegie-2017]
MAARSEVSNDEVATLRGRNAIERGKVGEVRQKFQVHEDKALAYKMQSDEFKDHALRNKEQRKSVRAGVRTAKETYLEEVKSAGILPDESVAEIEHKEWLTEELRRRIDEEENLAKTKREIQRIQDEEIAYQVQHDEVKRRRYEEYKRQQRIKKDQEERKRIARMLRESEEAEITDRKVRSMDDVTTDLNSDVKVVSDGTAIIPRHNGKQREDQLRHDMELRDEEIAYQAQREEERQWRHEEYKRQQRIKKDQEERKRIARMMRESEQAEISNSVNDTKVRPKDGVTRHRSSDVKVVSDDTAISPRHNGKQREDQLRQNMELRDEEIAYQAQREEERRWRHEEYKRQQRIIKDEEECNSVNDTKVRPKDGVTRHRSSDVKVVSDDTAISPRHNGKQREDQLRQNMELRDEEIAYQAQREEERQWRQEEYKRQQRIKKDEEEHKRLTKIMKELEEAEISSPDDDASDRPIDDVITLPTNNDIIVLADGTAIDARANEIQTEEQLRQKMQRRDEELAMLLQEQEKHQIEKKKSMQEDYRKAIELQDREIAKHLQREEKVKAHRRREKQLRRERRASDELLLDESRDRRHHDADYLEDVPPVSNEQQVNSRMHEEQRQGEKKTRHSRSKSEDSYEEMWQARSGSRTHALTSQTMKTPDDTAMEPGGHFSNIAETLDPTFQRATRHASEESSPEEDEKVNGLGRSTPIVPPLKRKISKDRLKKEKGKISYL